MASETIFRLHSSLLCIDRQTGTLVSLEPGSSVVYVSTEDRAMVTLRRAGREILAFAADFQDRADAVSARTA